MSSHLLKVEDLAISLKQSSSLATLIRNVSFTLDKREVLCIVGESGSGKSLTANTIMGLLPADIMSVSSGSITYDGADLIGQTEAELRKIRGARIAMIFQEPMTSLNPVLKIGLQVTEVLEAHGVPKEEQRAKALSLLENVGLPDPEGMMERYPFRLSGGQRQRVMIAMALAMEPDILIADEPTTALDVTTQAQILKLIHDLQRQHGMGIIFITHDFGVVADIADRVIVMRHGEIVEQGSKNSVLNHPQHTYTKSLIAAVAQFRTKANETIEAPPLIEVKSLTKIYKSHGGLFSPTKDVVAVNDVSFEICRGETLGLIGESGSGKSTIGQCIMRLTDIASGQILFDGDDVSNVNGSKLKNYRHQAQIIFQDPFASLNPRQTVGRSILTGPLAQGIKMDVAVERMNKLLKRVGLDPSVANRYPHEFSGGQRQRIGIARALAVEPKFLIADESVSALDVSVQAQVLELLREIKQEMQLTMLFITHDLRVASQICDRAIVLHMGQIVEEGEVTSLFSSPKHEYTKRLLAAVPGREWQETA